MLKTPCYATQSQTKQLEAYSITRRNIGHKDILIEIQFCGVCHTDLHYAKNDWGITKYPFVGGHEVIGLVKKFGTSVSGFDVDQRVAVGCFVNSCRTCSSCLNDLEQYCRGQLTKTYNDPTSDPGGHTFGGYSKYIVVDEHFVFTLPDNMNSAKSAPLLCAGITVFSPLNHWKVSRGMTVGIIGLGGLGHMAVKFSKALQAKTIVLTTSEGKVNDALMLGADEVIVSSKQSEMEYAQNKFDFILNTIPVAHNVNNYMELLKVDGTMCVVGSIGPTGELNSRPLIFGRRNISGSLVGGVNETQKMLDFCGLKNIQADVEIIQLEQINEA